MKIDSSLKLEQAIAQNPNSPCPDEILATLDLLAVLYQGFDRDLYVGQIVVAKTVTQDVRAFFDLALEVEFPVARVIPAVSYGWNDEQLMAKNVSSGFNYRRIAGSRELSRHALGLAFDVNPLQNPYIRYTPELEIVKPEGSTWRPEQPGTLTANHPLVKHMQGLGWEWGGDWTPDSGRTDYQHFQKVTP